MAPLLAWGGREGGRVVMPMLNIVLMVLLEVEL
jgi:hypothetical protein